VKDESLIEEMRAALNGDRERAKQRRKPRADASWIGAPPTGEPVEAPRRSFLARLGLRRPKA
jgi:hypothetical protein